MEPFRWRRALFLGLVSYAASLAGLVFDTFVPVLLQAGHPLWHNTMGLHAPLVGFALAPSLAFFIMTWDNLINIVVHPWAGVRSDSTWTRWGRRKPWILVGVPLAVTGLLTTPLARTLASVMLAILVTNLGRALFVPPMVAWLGDLFPAGQRSLGEELGLQVATADDLYTAMDLLLDGRWIDRATNVLNDDVAHRLDPASLGVHAYPADVHAGARAPLRHG